MDREIDMEAVSDGKLYGLHDLVKVGCEDCLGCSSCCRDMGGSIVLDPYDIYQIDRRLHKSFEEQLLEESIELGVVDGILLPNLKMMDNSRACFYLSETGRCSIHDARPGICRLFPLGRFYEGRSFQYFLQVHECVRENRTKVKVKKWLDIPSPAQYEQFVIDWHYFLRDIQQDAKCVLTGSERKNGEDGAGQDVEMERIKGMNMYLLRQFFMRQYLQDIDFYAQFYQRLHDAKAMLEVDGSVPMPKGEKV